MKEWVLEHALKEGKKIDAQTAGFLLKAVGCEQAAVHSEFEKLLSYIGERQTITAKDIAAICTKINLENGWQLGESIFRCDARGALRIVRALMEEGNPFNDPQTSRSQFQTEFQVCSILHPAEPPNMSLNNFPT